MKKQKTVAELSQQLDTLKLDLQELKQRVLYLENIGQKHEPAKTHEKITLEEFWDSKEDLAIHCDTEEKASTLLKAFDRMGKKWTGGVSYLKTNHWYDYKKCTVYTNNNCFGKTDELVEECDYKIYEFEDVIFPPEPKWEFAEEEKLFLNLVKDEYKWIAKDEDGEIYLYSDKPIKTVCSWKKGCWEHINMRLLNLKFATLSWEDTEPCPFREYI